MSPGIAGTALGGQEEQVGEVWLDTGRALASSSPVSEWRLHLLCKYLWRREWPFHTLHYPAASPVPTKTAVLHQSKPVSFQPGYRFVCPPRKLALPSPTGCWLGVSPSSWQTSYCVVLGRLQSHSALKSDIWESQQRWYSATELDKPQVTFPRPQTGQDRGGRVPGFRQFAGLRTQFRRVQDVEPGASGTWGHWQPGSQAAVPALPSGHLLPQPRTLSLTGLTQRLDPSSRPAATEACLMGSIHASQELPLVRLAGCFCPLCMCPQGHCHPLCMCGG